MAIKCKVFIHDTSNLASDDGDSDGKLAEDVYTYRNSGYYNSTKCIIYND